MHAGKAACDGKLPEISRQSGMTIALKHFAARQIEAAQE
jgi:hypothetical protein